MVFDVSGELFPLVIGTLSDEILNSNLAFDTISSTNAFPMGCGAIFMNLQESTAAVTIHFVQYSTHMMGLSRFHSFVSWILLTFSFNFGCSFAKKWNERL